LLFQDSEVQGWDIERRVGLGLSLVPERRELFASMSVRDNLLLGGFRLYRAGVRGWRDTLDEVYALFPRLKERSGQAAGTLSGGERQMLALGRALMARPALLMLDEPSLGLAPRVVREIFQTIAQLRRTGVAILPVEQNSRPACLMLDEPSLGVAPRVAREIFQPIAQPRSTGVSTLLVEQNARAALHVADRGYVLETGTVILDGEARMLAGHPRVIESYLGLAGTQKHS